MKKILTIILACMLALQAAATVKPRRGGRMPVEHQQETQGRWSAAPRKVGSKASAPLTSVGSPKVPVILVQFADLKFTSGLGTTTDAQGNVVRNQCLDEMDELVVNDFYSDFCNGKGGSGYYTGAGSYGAITEYFRDQSNGLFTPDFVIIGPVTLDSIYSYYGKNEGRRDTNISKFYSEAISKAQQVYSNWRIFDNDGNGSVDMAFFVYAGEGENGCDDPNTIWPKESSNGGTHGGVRFGCYACCNEIYAGETDGIGVFVHELSHALGLPDFYDTNYVAYGMDYWDVMDSGCYCHNSYCPCNYTSYERAFMGWTSIETLDPSQPRKLTLYPSSYYGQDYEWKAYKMVNPENPDEYYLLENRQPIGWDLFVGRGTLNSKMRGMLVIHVDSVGSRWTSNSVNTDKSHQYMTIVPADGELFSYMDVEDEPSYVQFLYSAYGDLYPGYYKVTELPAEKQTVYTASNTMNQPLYDITQNDDGTITLYYMTRRGDVNLDGTIDIKDVVSVINIMAGNNSEGYDGDVNADGTTDIKDVVEIINIMAGIDG